MSPRSFLFTPADSDKKVDKALASGADAIILDLEDSVAPSAKAKARLAAAQRLAAWPTDGPEAWVRINPISSAFWRDDIAAVWGAKGLVVPKTRSGADLAELQRALGADAAMRFLPIVTETPQSLFALGTYASAGGRLAGMAWGAEDLSAAVGARSPRDEHGRLCEPYQLARSLCLFAAAAAATPAIETVYPDFRDEAGLAAYAARAARDGFSGMLAIHPAQLAPIHAAFTPDAAALAHAERVVAAFRDAPESGVVALDGVMLDAPHLLAAERLLARRR